MNKIFKTIWNHVTQSLVVVSELAKGHGKSSSSSNSLSSPKTLKSFFKLTLISLCLLPSFASGVTAGRNEIKNSGTDGIAIGGGTSVGNNALSIGVGVVSYGDGSIAIGSEYKPDKSKPGSATIAGETSKSGQGAGKGNAIAIGINVKAQHFKATAIGSDAKATFKNSVALGSGATTSAGIVASGATQIGNYSYALPDATKLADTSYVFSIGNDKLLRQLQYVANGALTESSTDAVNGGQLYSALKTVGENLDAIKLAKADKSTTYKFKVGTQDAKTWTLKDGNEITFTSGNSNIIASAVKNSGIQYTLNNTLNLTASGSVYAGGVTINSNGIEAGNKQIWNIKESAIQQNGKAAVTTGQLFTTNQNVSAVENRATKLEDRATSIESNHNALKKEQDNLESAHNRLQLQ